MATRLKARPPEAEVLRQLGWLSRMPVAFQDAVFEIAVWRTLAPGAMVSIGGDADGGLWGVVTGQVDLISAVGVVDAPIAGVVLPGHWMGAAPIFGYPRGISGIARMPTLIAELPAGKTRALLDGMPGSWRYIGDALLEVANRWGGGLSDLVIRDTRSRCIAVLLRLTGVRWRDPVAGQTMTITFTQDEFAGSTGMSRQVAGDVLRALDAEGLVTLGYRSITVNDPARLRAMIDHDRA